MMSTISRLFLAWGQMALSAFLAWIVAGILDSLNVVQYFVGIGNTQQNDNVILFVWGLSFAGFFYLIWVFTNRWKDKNLKPKQKTH